MEFRVLNDFKEIRDRRVGQWLRCGRKVAGVGEVNGGENAGAQALSEGVEARALVRSPEDNEERAVSEIETGHNGAPQTREEIATVGDGVGIENQGHAESVATYGFGFAEGDWQGCAFAKERIQLPALGGGHAVFLIGVGESGAEADISGEGGPENCIGWIVAPGADEEPLRSALSALVLKGGYDASHRRNEPMAEPSLELRSVVAGVAMVGGGRNMDGRGSHSHGKYTGEGGGVRWFSNISFGSFCAFSAKSHRSRWQHRSLFNLRNPSQNTLEINVHSFTVTTSLKKKRLEFWKCGN